MEWEEGTPVAADSKFDEKEETGAGAGESAGGGLTMVAGESAAKWPEELPDGV